MNKKINDINKRLGEFAKNAVTKSNIENSALIVKNNIFLRTSAGKSPNGGSFEKYSESYSKREGKSIVSMTKSGDMLGAMTQKALSDDKAIIFFNTSEARKLAEIHNKKGAGKSKIVRAFFQPSKSDRKKAVNAFRHEVMKQLKRKGF